MFNLNCHSPKAGKITKSLLFAGISLMIVGCQTGGMMAKKSDPAMVAKAQAMTSKKFASNVSTYAAKNGAEKAVLGVLSNKLVAGYNGQNAGTVSSALAPNFKYKLVSSEKTALIEAKASFESSLKWRTQVQGLDYAVQSIKVAPNGNSALAIALATYRSENFQPRFLETLVLNKSGGNWKVEQQSQMTLYPAVPELHKVTLFLTQSFWDKKKYPSFTAYFADVARTQGPEAIIQMLKSKSIAPQGKTSHAIAVFNEAPAKGSNVSVSLVFNSGNVTEHVSNVPVKFMNTYFVAEAIAWGEPLAREIEVGVALNGIKLGSKKFKQK